MTRLQHTTQITAIVVLLYITEAVVSRPNLIVTRSDSPTYTSQLIGQELRKQYVALQKQNEPVKVLIEMLVQVSGKHSPHWSYGLIYQKLRIASSFELIPAQCNLASLILANLGSR